MGRRLIAAMASMIGAFALVAGALMTGSIAGAQDSTPQVTEDDVPRPAHIHFDTCDNLGDVAVGLNDLTGLTIQGSPVASPVVEDVESPDVVQGEAVIESVTDAEIPFDDLVSSSYAINVHDSAENIDLYIACGDISGEPQDGRLEVEMQQLNDSGFNGVAVLEDNGDGTTTVTVTLQDTSAGTPVS